MTSSEQRITELLTRFQCLLRQCRARNRAGIDDTSLRREMTLIKRKLGREEAKQKFVKVIQ